MNKIKNAVRWFLSGFPFAPFYLWTPREIDFGFQLAFPYHCEDLETRINGYIQIYLGPLTLGVDFG